MCEVQSGIPDVGSDGLAGSVSSVSCQEFPKGLQPRWKSLQANASWTKVSMGCGGVEGGKARVRTDLRHLLGHVVAENVCYV